MEGRYVGVCTWFGGAYILIPPYAVDLEGGWDISTSHIYMCLEMSVARRGECSTCGLRLRHLLLYSASLKEIMAG